MGDWDEQSRLINGSGMSPKSKGSDWELSMFLLEARNVPADELAMT